MAFRADESAQRGLESAKNYLFYREMDSDERLQSEDRLYEIVDKYGPVIDRYPSWHPLISNHDARYPQGYPGRESGYSGLDHTVTLANAFITCPYGDGQEVIDSVKALPLHPAANLNAERLDVKFYRPSAQPILVSCEWHEPIDVNGMIPAAIAVPLMLQNEVPCWEWASVAETWETMRPYFLGEPHGSRSSLFVEQDTALTMKKIWTLLINTGMYGPIKVSNQY